MRTIAPPTSADFLGDTCREKSFADGVNERGIFDAVGVRRENLLPALELRFCLLALKAGRNTAERSRIERKGERQIVAHGNELQQQIHQILIAGAGRFVGREFDVLPSGQMIDLPVKNILLEPVLLVIEKLAGIAVHRAGSSSRADAVRKHGESGGKLGLSLGQLDHLV